VNDTGRTWAERLVIAAALVVKLALVFMIFG